MYEQLKQLIGYKLEEIEVNMYNNKHFDLYFRKGEETAVIYNVSEEASLIWSP